MDREAIFLIILAIFNIPLYLLIGKYFFGNWKGFWKAIYFWFKPDFMSWWDGEYWRDQIHEFVLWLFFVLCGGMVFGEFILIKTVFSSF